MSTLTTPFDPTATSSGMLTTNLSGNPGTLLLLNDSACNLTLTLANGSQRDLPAQTWRRLDLPQGDSAITWNRIGILLIAVPNSMVYGEAYQSGEEISEVFPASVVRAVGGLTSVGALSVSALLFPSPDNWQISEDGSGNLDITDSTTGNTYVLGRNGQLTLVGPVEVDNVGPAIQQQPASPTSDMGLWHVKEGTVGAIEWSVNKGHHSGGNDAIYFFDDTGNQNQFAIGPKTGAAVTVLAGQNTAGSFGVAPITSSVFATVISTTGLHTIVTFTPTVDSIWRMNGMVDVGDTTPAKQVFQVAYTPKSQSARTTYFIALIGSAVLPLDGATNTAVASGSLACMPFDITVKANTTVTISYNNPGGTPNDQVTAIVERLA